MDHRSIGSAGTMMSSNKNGKKVGEQMSRGNDDTTAMRKGPWTEEEDAQLVWFVRLFGERRWDFLAKVSGLRRTGKSCRLRWVNYLHPGLRRGRITADEERLILELHERWGSRWSRIARSLPGRTDNEIKNFWRTRTRKHKAAAAAHQEPRDDTTTASESSSTSSSSRTTTSCSGSPSSRAAPSSSAVTTGSAMQQSSSGGGDGDDEAELDEAASTATAASHHHQQPQQLIKEEYYTMDQLWNEIAAAELAASYAVDGWGAAAEPASPVWEFCSDYSLWKIDDEEYYKKMLDAS